MIPDTVLQQIQDRLDIVEIISASVPLKRSGRSFKAPCPFHPEKTPSFYVTPDKQIFHCFGCGVGGNVFSFIMKLEKRDFLEVVKELAERVGVELPNDFAPKDREREERLAVASRVNSQAMNFYHDFLLKSPEAQKARVYLRGRGLNEETLDRFKIGLSPDSWDALLQQLRGQAAEKTLERIGLVLERKEKNGYYDRFRNRIIFPILDMKGICVAFGGRVMDDSLPKYMNSPESEFYSKGQHLYGLFWAKPAIREKDALIVVEGYMDFAMLFQAGIQNVVASLGTALTRDQVRLIKRHTHNVTMLYDADKAGETATMRGLELFLEEGLEVKIVRLPQGHDPDSFVHKEGTERFHEELSQAKNLFDYKLTLLRAQENAQTVEGRVKIANEMVILLAKVQNEILRAAWIRELSQGLGLPEEALTSQMKKPQGAAAHARLLKPESLFAAPKLGEDADKRAEMLLIGLMMESTQYAKAVSAVIQPEDFHGADERKAAGIIFEHLEETTSASRIINRHPEDADLVKLVSTASAEMDAIADKMRTLEDCLAWMKRVRLKAEQEGLKHEIADAQRIGDKNRLKNLLEHFTELNKGIKK